MKIEILKQEFSVCKVKNLSQFDMEEDFYFVGKTDEEISLVCVTQAVPQNILACENDWRAFRIQGVLDFSLTGILSKITTLLAEKNIGIFAVSTYNTDYILTKSENLEAAISILKSNGYEIV